MYKYIKQYTVIGIKSKITKENQFIYAEADKIVVNKHTHLYTIRPKINCIIIIYKYINIPKNHNT